MPNWSLVSYHAPIGRRDSPTRGARARRHRPGADAFAGRTLLEVIDDWQDVADDLLDSIRLRCPCVADATLVAPLRYPRKIICAGRTTTRTWRRWGCRDRIPLVRRTSS